LAIVKSINAQPATGAEALWSLINLLVGSAGYSKIKDSDGSAMSSSGTQVTSGSAGANGLGNDSAWVLLRSPDSALYISIQHSANAANRNWRFKCSTATPTGGSATQVPTATDDAVYSGGGTDASPTFNDEVIGESDGSSYWFNAVATTTAPYVFCAFSWADGAPSGNVSSLIFLDFVQAWTLASADVFPYVLKAVSIGSGNDCANIAALSQPDPGVSRTAPWTWLAKGLGGEGFVLTPMSGRANSITVPQAPDKVPVNPVTGKFDLLPIEYLRDSDAPADPKGLKGWSTLFSWRPLTTHATGDLYSAAGTKDNIALSDLVLNLWAGDTPSGTGTTPATRSARIFTAPAPDSTVPVISNWVPTPGTTIQPGTALQFDVTDVNADLNVIVVKVAFAGGGAFEIAHDGSQLGPNYSGSRTVITNGFRYVLNRSGGWPSTPTITIYAVDSSGNLDV
jgi:hypothetical protein